MFGVAVATVHTSGVNWGSIVVIGLMTIGIVGGFSRWIIGRLDSIRSTMQNLDRRLTRVEDHINKPVVDFRRERWWR